MGTSPAAAARPPLRRRSAPSEGQPLSDSPRCGAAGDADRAGGAGGRVQAGAARGGDGGGARAAKAGSLEAFVGQVVLVYLPKEEGGDSYALVLRKGSGKCAGYLDVVWLLTSEQALKYSRNLKTPAASRKALQSAGLGPRELLFTDWMDSVHHSTVNRARSPLTVHLHADRVGADLFCRFACVCTDGCGEWKDVGIEFDPSWTLREVARWQRFRTSQQLARWMKRELCAVSVAGGGSFKEPPNCRQQQCKIAAGVVGSSSVRSVALAVGKPGSMEAGGFPEEMEDQEPRRWKKPTPNDSSQRNALGLRGGRGAAERLRGGGGKGKAQRQAPVVNSGTSTKPSGVKQGPGALAYSEEIAGLVDGPAGVLPARESRAALPPSNSQQLSSAAVAAAELRLVPEVFTVRAPKLRLAENKRLHRFTPLSGHGRAVPPANTQGGGQRQAGKNDGSAGDLPLHPPLKTARLAKLEEASIQAQTELLHAQAKAALAQLHVVEEREALAIRASEESRRKAAASEEEARLAMEDRDRALQRADSLAGETNRMHEEVEKAAKALSDAASAGHDMCSTRRLTHPTRKPADEARTRFTIATEQLQRAKEREHSASTAAKAAERNAAAIEAAAVLAQATATLAAEEVARAAAATDSARAVFARAEAQRTAQADAARVCTS